MKIPNDYFSSEIEDFETSKELESGKDEKLIDRMQEGEQLDGNLKTDLEEERLAHTIVDVNTDNIDEGTIVEEAFNNNTGSFMPDMMFKDLVKNFKNAEKLYGETLIRELSGYDPRFIDKNVKIPEFQRELQKRLEEKAEDLKNKGLLKKNGTFTKEALNTAALFLIKEEYETSLQGPKKIFGTHRNKKFDIEGDKTEVVRNFRKGDPYKNISARHSVNKAIRRQHKQLMIDDLMVHEKESFQEINIVYALDTSGSMKGNKIKLAKRAGVSLANKAINDGNKVGLVLFGSTIEKQVNLTKDFYTFVKPLVTTMASNETDLSLAIKTSLHLLEEAKGLRHIIILTDGLHTNSKIPFSKVFEQVMIAREKDITISMVGINLDTEGLELARKIVDISQGRLFAVKDLKDVGSVIIGDYDALLN